ncbi:serine hydrolase domain-containing protein [Pseudonocardia alni]|uniref:CubicO group peptidase (Beta-lactamase class C family) n=1 Tax=Pseudonocardia alni TaxID=33907 RepID=A0A852W3W0_PSEA5|nr:serine hydrolase [Pseudonocardia antarctica]NYG01075.1 CubicO group peptidase (beta-lactamase class C family) [Pseudonocardia antarctica]
MRNRTVVRVVATVAAGAALIGFTVAGHAQAAPSAEPERASACALPASGNGFERATPESQQLDPEAVREAVAYAATHLRTTVKIFRNNCLVADGPLDRATEQVPWNVWSSTKSVTSMLTGIAADQGRLALDDPIGRYLPTGPGWGDAEHRAITVRDLLTQTSGLQQAVLAEAGTTGLDPDVAREALAQPLTHEPGTHFAYSQRPVDLLAHVVQRAVGEDLQEFAQRDLFGPIGIAPTDYAWLRDRSGNTYGYAHLFITPAQYAKLGLLMQNDGTWNGRRVLSSDYVREVGRPTRTNGCYGLLFWTNAGAPCTGADVPSAVTVPRTMIPSAPDDLYAMVGFLQQNNFVIPSLGMTVSWTGVLGDTTPELSGLISATPGASDLYYNFFRILMRGVQDRHIPDPGPFVGPPQQFDVDPLAAVKPEVLLTDLVPGTSCNVVVCGGTVPTAGSVENGRSVLGSVVGGP